MKFKAVHKKNNSWNYGGSYQKIIPNKDYKLLSLLLSDLSRMGYPIEKAFNDFKSNKEDSDLFFLN